MIALRDYMPDSNNAAAAFAAALRACAETGAQLLQLEAGEYHFTTSQTHKTLSIAHDDGCGDIAEKQVHVLLQGLQGLTIRGAVNPDGSPATTLVGLYNGHPQTLQPSVLWAEGCKNLRLENLTFTRAPETVSGGRVLAAGQGTVTVEVDDGLYAADGMAAYCMNRFDGLSNLSGPSLTFGFGLDARWQHIGGRQYRLAAALPVQPGDTLSWHMAGKTDFLLYFGRCDGLQLHNLRIYNTNSFGILTECCDGITAKALRVAPKPGRRFTSPRDGWKVYRCTGDILLEGCHIEGTRMDGQNVHSNYLVVERAEGNTLLCACKYAPLPLQNGTVLDVGGLPAVIQGWEVVGERWEQSHSGPAAGAAMAAEGKNRVSLYHIVLAEPVAVRPGTLCVASCWQPRSYTCKGTTFRNIAGAGQLLRCGNVLIENCHYENLMNAGVLLGAELSTHSEAGHAVGVTVQNSVFVNCGWRPRYGPKGCGGIAVKSQGFAGPVNRDIVIAGNLFQNCATGIELNDAGNLRIEGNRFENVESPVKTDEATCEGVYIQ